MHTKVAAVELKVKDYKEQLHELQESNKRQAGMLAVYAQNPERIGITIAV